MNVSMICERHGTPKSMTARLLKLEKDRGDVPGKEVVSHVLRDDVLIRFKQVEIAMAQLCGDFESNVKQLTEAGVVVC